MTYNEELVSWLLLAYVLAYNYEIDKLKHIALEIRRYDNQLASKIIEATSIDGLDRISHRELLLALIETSLIEYMEKTCNR